MTSCGLGPLTWPAGGPSPHPWLPRSTHSLVCPGSAAALGLPRVGGAPTTNVSPQAGAHTAVSESQALLPPAAGQRGWAQADSTQEAKRDAAPRRAPVTVETDRDLWSENKASEREKLQSPVA